MNRILVFLTATLLLVAAMGSFATVKKPIVCDNTYALCSAAQCQQIPGIKGRVLCQCSIWKGKNIGFSTCRARQLRETTEGDKKLVSTFAFGGGHYQFLTCPGGNAWASCLDQPCLVDKTSANGRRAYCTCKKVKNSRPYVTFAGNCDKKYCAKAIWSGATITGNQQLASSLAKSLGKPELMQKASCKK